MQTIIVAILIVLAIMLGNSLVKRGARRAAAFWFTFLVVALATYLVARPPHQPSPMRQFLPRINR